MRSVIFSINILNLVNALNHTPYLPKEDLFKLAAEKNERSEDKKEFFRSFNSPKAKINTPKP